MNGINYLLDIYGGTGDRHHRYLSLFM
jgi:hypothetical protein